MNCPICNAIIPEGQNKCSVCGFVAGGQPIDQQADASFQQQNPYVNNNDSQNYQQPQAYYSQPQQPYQQPQNFNQPPQGYYGQPPQGYPQYNGFQPYNQFNPNDVPSGGMNFLAFIIPLIGIILYFVEKDKTPNKSKAMLKWAIIGWVSSFVFVIIMYAVIFAIGMSSGGYYY